MSDARYYVQSGCVRGERRSYWIEDRLDKNIGRHRKCVEDFGVEKRKADRRCAELNASELKKLQKAS